MKNMHSRLAKLEVSVRQAKPAEDWRAKPAYAALSEADRKAVDRYVERFNSVGLEDFSDDELEDFERILLPLSSEETGYAEPL